VSASTPPTAIERSPTASNTFKINSLFCKSGYTRPRSKTPAATIAAECRYAETGVGAAIARGSQKCSGTCALFASAAIEIRSPETFRSAPGSTRSTSSGTE
jgi:hypothetical protein